MGAETLLLELCQARLVHSYIKKKKKREKILNQRTSLVSIPGFIEILVKKTPLEHLNN